MKKFRYQAKSLKKGGLLLLPILLMGMLLVCPMMVRASNNNIAHPTMPDKKLVYVVVKEPRFDAISESLEKITHWVENQANDSVYVGTLFQDTASSFLKSSSSNSKFSAHLFFLTKEPEKIEDCKVVKRLILHAECRFLPDTHYLLLPSNGWVVKWKEKTKSNDEAEKLLVKIRKYEAFTSNFKAKEFLFSHFTDKELKSKKKHYLRSVVLNLEVEDYFGVTYFIAGSIYKPNQTIGH